MKKRNGLPTFLLALLLLFTAVNVTFAQGGTTTPVPYTLPAGSGLITAGLAGELQNFGGTGSTAAAPLWTTWADAYRGITGVTVDYTGTGSGAGITGITDCTVQFGGSDSPMSDDQLKAAQTDCGKDGVLHLPVAIMGVSPIYNIPELPGTPLMLTAETTCKMFLGQIAYWDDAALVANNPGLSGVHQAVATVVRSDSSGTSNIFTSWCNSASEAWKASGVGAGSTVTWPGSATLAEKGNAGIAGEVAGLPYSIGYVETTYAVQNALASATIQNSAGNWTVSTPESISASADGVTLPPDMRIKLVNSSNPNAYPISGFTWALMRVNQPDLATGESVVRFMWFATHDGQANNGPMGYAPIPENVIQWDENALASVMFDGKPVMPADLMAHVSPLPEATLAP